MTSLYSFSQLNTYNTCPRAHYFSYVRRFRSTRDAPALAFGGAWGRAMDSVWQSLNTDHTMDTNTVVERAMDYFLNKWEEQGFERYLSIEQLDDLAPRTPITAEKMLFEYIETRRHFFSQIDLISIEEPFVVPISSWDTDRFYVGLMDKVYLDKRDNRIYCCDHKTTTLYARAGFFRSSFLESFSPNAQMDGYQFALKYKYGKKAKHVVIDAALVHKTVHNGFRFVPVFHTDDQLDAWLYELHTTVSEIEHESIPDTVESNAMNSYPRRTNSCHHYNGCGYLDICKATANPQTIHTPPGFEVSETTTAERLGISQEKLDRTVEEYKCHMANT